MSIEEQVEEVSTALKAGNTVMISITKRMKVMAVKDGMYYDVHGNRISVAEPVSIHIF